MFHVSTTLPFFATARRFCGFAGSSMCVKLKLILPLSSVMLLICRYDERPSNDMAEGNVLSENSVQPNDPGNGHSSVLTAPKDDGMLPGSAWAFAHTVYSPCGYVALMSLLMSLSFTMPSLT